MRFLPPGRRPQVVCRRCARRSENADLSWQSCSSGLVASSGEETETVAETDRPRELGPEEFDKVPLARRMGDEQESQTGGGKGSLLNGAHGEARREDIQGPGLERPRIFEGGGVAKGSE